MGTNRYDGKTKEPKAAPRRGRKAKAHAPAAGCRVGLLLERLDERRKLARDALTLHRSRVEMEKADLVADGLTYAKAMLGGRASARPVDLYRYLSPEDVDAALRMIRAAWRGVCLPAAIRAEVARWLSSLAHLRGVSSKGEAAPPAPADARLVAGLARLKRLADLLRRRPDWQEESPELMGLYERRIVELEQKLKGDRPDLATDPRGAVELLADELGNDGRPRVAALALKAGQVIGRACICEGAGAHVITSFADFFRPAVDADAPAVVIVRTVEAGNFERDVYSDRESLGLLTSLEKKAEALGLELRGYVLAPLDGGAPCDLVTGRGCPARGMAPAHLAARARRLSASLPARPRLLVLGLTEGRLVSWLPLHEAESWPPAEDDRAGRHFERRVRLGALEVAVVRLTGNGEAFNDYAFRDRVADWADEVGADLVGYVLADGSSCTRLGGGESGLV